MPGKQALVTVSAEERTYQAVPEHEDDVLEPLTPHIQGTVSDSFVCIGDVAGSFFPLPCT